MSQFTLTSVGYPCCVSPEPTVVDCGDGSYQVSLTPECSGCNLVSVSINGKTINDIPMTIAVIPPYTSLKLKQTITSVSHPNQISFAKNGDAFFVIGMITMSITLTGMGKSSTVGGHQETIFTVFWCMVTTTTYTCLSVLLPKCTIIH